MKTIYSIAPAFAEEVRTALLSEHRPDLAAQCLSAVVDRCTFDHSANAGYIYLSCPAHTDTYFNPSSAVAETIAFAQGFNVDVDHHSHIVGIEFVSRHDVRLALASASAV